MAEPRAERRGLGRGLSALMADVGSSTADVESQAATEGRRPADRTVPIERLHPNPDQPRRRFDGPALAELAESIAARGVIQPLIVRAHPHKPDHFEIVAGERRWRAAQKAQLHDIPVVVREFSDIEVLEVAIIENIQRADLNPVEEAHGYRQLIEKFGHTQEQMAEALGKSRSHIANLMRLLSLPDEVLEHIKEGRLTAGHARALITCDSPSDLARHVIAKGLSVRETEKLVKGDGSGGQAGKGSGSTKTDSKDADTLALEADLSAALGHAVSIDHKGGAGNLIIRYKSLEDLDDLCGKLSASR